MVWVQDPAAADKLAKIQRDLDETKIILHQTIESVLDRGEKLDQVGGAENRVGAAGLLGCGGPHLRSEGAWDRSCVWGDAGAMPGDLPRCESCAWCAMCSGLASVLQ